MGETMFEERAGVSMADSLNAASLYQVDLVLTSKERALSCLRFVLVSVRERAQFSPPVSRTRCGRRKCH